MVLKVHCPPDESHQLATAAVKRKTTHGHSSSRKRMRHDIADKDPDIKRMFGAQKKKKNHSGLSGGATEHRDPKTRPATVGNKLVLPGRPARGLTGMHVLSMAATDFLYSSQRKGGHSFTYSSSTETKCAASGRRRMCSSNSSN